MTERRDNTDEDLYDAMLAGLKAGRHTLRIDTEKAMRFYDEAAFIDPFSVERIPLQSVHREEREIDAEGTLWWTSYDRDGKVVMSGNSTNWPESAE